MPLLLPPPHSRHLRAPITYVHVVPQLSSAVLRVLEALELYREDGRQSPNVHLLRSVVELLTTGAVPLFFHGRVVSCVQARVNVEDDRKGNRQDEGGDRQEPYFHPIGAVGAIAIRLSASLAAHHQYK